VALLGAALSSVWLLRAQAPMQEPVLQAMKDEIARDMKISLPGIDPPYFIQYLIDDEEHFNVSATLGGVLLKGRERIRQPQVIVRVGDYKFDNGNFTGGFSSGARYDLGRFPLEDSYPILRRYLWLQTDSAYKGAVAGLSRKRAALRNLTQSETLDDFEPAKPVTSIHPFQKLTVDEDAWTNRIRAMSAIFEQYPDVKNSSVEFETSIGGFYLVNSEGTQVQSPETVTSVRIRGSGQAADGMNIRDDAAFESLDVTRMPSEVDMTKGAKAVAEHVTALMHAPKGGDYSGPVLFEGEAAPQVFAEVFGRNLTVTRRPVSAGGRGGGGASAEPGELEGRVGARVLPEFFDVVDDPSQKEWRGRPLFGTYDVDREGMPPQPLRLVEKGVLKTYFLTRQPVRGYSQSNGHARLPGTAGAGLGAMSNFFVSASETVPVSELKTKLLDLIKTRSKPYGIIVRKMDFPLTASSTDELRRLFGSTGGGRPVSPPLLVYKVFPDGHEELVRGLRFRNFSARSLKDIMAAGDDNVTFEYMDNGAPLGLVGAGSFQVETSVVAPSFLIDDLELHAADEEMPKLPIVPSPDTAGGH
jgi:hypothetical protein